MMSEPPPVYETETGPLPFSIADLRQPLSPPAAAVSALIDRICRHHEPMPVRLSFSNVRNLGPVSISNCHQVLGRFLALVNMARQLPPTYRDECLRRLRFAGVASAQSYLQRLAEGREQ